MKEVERGPIELDSLQAWLIGSGWSRNELITGGFSLWVNVGHELLVPNDDHAPDFRSRILETLRDLALSADMAVDEMATAIRFGSSDIVDWRFSGGGVESGLVQLGAGTEFMDNIRRSFMAAAASTIFRRGYFGRRVPISARQFADGVLLAPTRSGSYIFPTAVRITASEVVSSLDTLSVKPAIVPFGRRAVEALAQALNSIQRYEDSGSLPTKKDSVELVRHGLSYEFCTAISTLFEDEKSGQVEVGFNWSNRLPPTGGTTKSVRLSNESLPVLEAMRNSLFESGVTATQKFFVYVTTLHKDDPVGTAGGVINVKTVGAPSSQLLRVELPEDSYQTAVRAHELHEPLEIVGRLVESGGHRAKIEMIESVNRRSQAAWQ